MHNGVNDLLPRLLHSSSQLPRIKNVRGQTANQSTNCYIQGKHSRGHPCKKWINNIQEDLNCLQLNMKEAMDIVRDRQEWRHHISTSSSPLGWWASKKKKKKKKEFTTASWTYKLQLDCKSALTLAVACHKYQIPLHTLWKSTKY